MEITTTVNEGVMDVAIEGRLDGYWSDHLDRALTEVVRDGHHRVRLDCGRLTFLSSAGIAVLLKFYKELRALSGSFRVVNASNTVLAALKLTRLTELLVDPAGGTAAAAKPAPAPAQEAVQQIERDGAGFDVHQLEPRAQLTCREIGSPAPLDKGAFQAADCRSLDALDAAFVVGVGAFGGGFDDCQDRFGELLSVAGATAYQPAGNASVADYLLANGALTSDVQLLYGLSCEGRFSHLVRFEMRQRGKGLPLSALVDACFTATGHTTIGVVVIAETVGLVGASLRRSPALPLGDSSFFAHPGVRTRLSFTAEPSFAQGVTLAAGVVSRAPGAAGHPLMRPTSSSTVGHVHAAAFRFRPLKKGRIDLRETVTGLFEPEHLQGVLHLLHDDRGASGAGESEFVRGACWVGPASGPWD